MLARSSAAAWPGAVPPPGCRVPLCPDPLQRLLQAAPHPCGRPQARQAVRQLSRRSRWWGGNGSIGERRQAAGAAAATQLPHQPPAECMPAAEHQSEAVSAVAAGCELGTCLPSDQSLQLPSSLQAVQQSVSLRGEMAEKAAICKAEARRGGRCAALIAHTCGCPPTAGDRTSLRCGQN